MLREKCPKCGKIFYDKTLLSCSIIEERVCDLCGTSWYSRRQIIEQVFKPFGEEKC